MDGVTPSVAVCYKDRPLAVVKVAGTKSFLQGVFEALLWSPSVALATSDLWQAVVFHPGDMSFLT